MQTQLDLTAYHIVRPERVRWIYPQTSNDILTLLRSKTARRFLQKIDDAFLAQHNITWSYEVLTAETYREWLTYYQQKMSEHHYDILATKEWFEEVTQTGATVEGLFFYQAQKMIGSAVIERRGEESAIEKFKASDRINLSDDDNSSIGIVIDYFFLREMKKIGIHQISAGRSRNAFGVINAVGYLEYKLRFGYEPQPEKDTALLTDVPLNEEGYVACFGLEGEKLSLFLFIPKGDERIVNKLNSLIGKVEKTIIEYEPAV